MRRVHVHRHIPSLALVASLACSFGCRSILGIDDPQLVGAEGDAAGPPGDVLAIDACVDSDGDTVCDAVDTCATADDLVDTDADGVPDGCDDWPCGAKPAAPLAHVTSSHQSNQLSTTITLSDTMLAAGSFGNGAQGQFMVASPGATIALMTRYSIVDCICPGCRDQIEYGFAGHRLGCLYDANPQGNGECALETTGAVTRTFTAPTTPGAHELRFNLGQAFECGDTTGWFSPPASSLTIAHVCVR